jgi:glycosyltransferase involved in cell wall biosynthesis
MAAKVSIITVVFNGKEFLEKTFESVFAQRFSSVEYIVVDGNSTDGTLDLIKNNQNRISQWISEPDKGLYDAMNKALKMATGEFVLFMNAGDLFQDEYVLERIFQQAPPEADILYGDTMLVDETGIELGLRSVATPHKLPENLDWKDFKFGMVVCHQSILIRRTLAESYNTVHPYCADIDWIIKSLKKTTHVHNANLVVARFLKGGISDKRLKKSLKDRFSVLSEHFGFLPTLLNHIWISIRAVWFYKIKH